MFLNKRRCQHNLIQKPYSQLSKTKQISKPYLSFFPFSYLPTSKLQQLLLSLYTKYSIYLFLAKLLSLTLKLFSFSLAKNLIARMF